MDHSDKNESKVKDNIGAGVFLFTVGGASAIFGFSRALASSKMSKKHDLVIANQQIPNSAQLSEEGARLALRALKWGTFWAISGTGLICLSIWKLSGARNFVEFRERMGSILPKLPKNNPPQSRTEFNNLTDLMTYLSVWGKEK